MSAYALNYFLFVLFILRLLVPLRRETKTQKIMTAIQLRAELFRELNPIFDSEVAMQKALTALRDIRRMVFTEVPATKTTVREGWSAAARKAHKEGADQMVAADIFEDDKVEDWQW